MRLGKAGAGVGPALAGYTKSVWIWTGPCVGVVIKMLPGLYVWTGVCTK